MLTTTYTLDELELPLVLRPTMAEVSTVVLESPAELTVEYQYEPEEREIMRPDPNDCQQGHPACVNVYSVTVATPMVFDNEGIALYLSAGFDLTNILPQSTINDMEDTILASIRNERRAA